jgi:hypothetical protein
MLSKEGERSVQLDGTFFKRKRGHAFPELAALNAEWTAVKKESVQHCFGGCTTSWRHRNQGKGKAQLSRCLAVLNQCRIVQLQCTEIEVLFAVNETVLCRF